MFFSECNNEIRGSFGGIIESPNFPDAYPHLRDCTWYNSHLYVREN